MDIRRLTTDDFAALAAIRAKFFPEDAGVDWPTAQFLSSSGVAVGAFIDDALIGYAAGGLRSHAEGAWDRPAGEQLIAYLEEWFVDEPHRRTGVGRALVGEVESWARQLHASHLASDTELGNEPSHAAHEATGFSEVERAVHFIKVLEPEAAVENVPVASVVLEELDETSGREIMRLEVAPAQLDFVAPNSISLAQAYLTDDVLVRGVFAGPIPIGFVMVSTREHRYYLWRFMIDHRYQGMGYGRRAMELLIDLVRSLPEAKELRLSYVPAPGGPGPFYRALGFEDTGNVHNGEHEMVLAL